METLQIYLFGKSYPSFEDLLKARRIPYAVPQQSPRSFGHLPDVLQLHDTPTSRISWGEVALAVREFCYFVPGRTVLLLLNDQPIRHAEDLNQSELERFLSEAESLDVFDSQLPLSALRKAGVHAVYRDYAIKIDAAKAFPGKPSLMWTGKFSAVNETEANTIDGKCSMIAWSREEVKAETLSTAKKAIDEHIDASTRR